MTELGLRGRVAVVTGASHGIGRAVTEPPPAQGASVCLFVRGVVLISMLIGCVTACDPNTDRHGSRRDATGGEAATSECTHDGGPCSRFGKLGECVRSRCILTGGLCTQDVDCDDDNVCTKDRCESGACVQDDAAGACSLERGGVGVCLSGECEPDDGVLCAADSDCPESANPCQLFKCEEGRCARTNREDGGKCETRAGRKGICSAGGCTLESMEPERRCKIYHTYWGPIEKCWRGLDFSLSPEEIAEQESKLERQLASELSYDLKVSLVELPGGGYNIVTHNRRPRTEVRGLCDPSFVAFHIAGFTQKSKWKSRMLQIWIRPYDEGWSLPTYGSRVAIRRGRERSGLGWLGVVNVSIFRKWLEKSFKPLPAVPMGPREALPMAVVPGKDGGGSTGVSVAE